jgi:hypothetical protein
VNVGTTVANMLSSLGTTPIFDGDANPLYGIAITAVDTSHGQWEFSLDGLTWSSLGTPTDGSAKLLSLSAKLRFVPTSGFTGTVLNGITFRAWDQVRGVNGGTASTLVNGGSTSFSSTTGRASVTVLP